MKESLDNPVKMKKITLKIEGMKCGMCEAHINDIIRKNFKIKKVISSCVKNETIIFSNDVMDEETLKNVITLTGYKILSIHTEEYEKKGILAIFKK